MRAQRVEHFVDAVGHADAALDRVRAPAERAQLGAQRLGLVVAVVVVDGDVRAARGELHRDRTADAARGTGHQRDLAIQGGFGSFGHSEAGMFAKGAKAGRAASRGTFRRAPRPRALAAEAGGANARRATRRAAREKGAILPPSRPLNARRFPPAGRARPSKLPSRAARAPTAGPRGTSAS